jgi:hypothetical protein
MMLRSALILPLLVTGIAAFLATPPTTARTTITRHYVKLNELDEQCIENVAEYCLQAEKVLGHGDAEAAGCDVEEIEALVNQLQEQRDLLNQHVKYIDSLLHKLQSGGINNAGEPADAYIAG